MHEYVQVTREKVHTAKGCQKRRRQVGIVDVSPSLLITKARDHVHDLDDGLPVAVPVHEAMLEVLRKTIPLTFSSRFDEADILQKAMNHLPW